MVPDTVSEIIGSVYFTAKDTERYVPVLQKLVDAYNSTKHSAHGYAPKDVNIMNGETVWRKLYNFKPIRRKPKYKKGALVRLSKAKKTFEKGYRTNWTKEVFRVTRVFRRPLPEYEVEALDGEEIVGKFLESELQGWKA